MQTDPDYARVLAPVLRNKVTRARSAFRGPNLRTQREINQSHTIGERLLARLASFFTVVAGCRREAQRCASARSARWSAGVGSRLWLGVFLFLAVFATHLFALEPVTGPEFMVYKAVAGSKLTVHVFRPARTRSVTVRPAIVLFHGGGWAAGSPEWVYDSAKRYASFGAVTFAAEYRLSDKNTMITPIEALEDARDVVRWMRQNASKLGIDPDHIAAYGISAGGHLAASLVFFNSVEMNQTSAVPNALLLISPAVAMAKDEYFQGLLGKRALGREYSPDEQMDKAPPPTVIFNGTLDNLTPLDGVRHYCELAKQHGGDCQLHVYEGVGHLFTRKQPFDTSTFDPDPTAWADATTKGDAFLAGHGFLPEWHAASASSAK